MRTAASPRVKRYTRSSESTATAATSACRTPEGSCSHPSTGVSWGALAADGRHAVDLEEPVLVHEPGDLDGGARRAVCAEEPIARRGDDRAIAHVSEVPVELHDVADARGAAAEDPLLRHVADEPLGLLAALEEDHRRDRPDPEASGGDRVRVDVELRDAHVVLLARDLLEDRCHHAARAAPRGPEVDEHRSLR